MAAKQKLIAQDLNETSSLERQQQQQQLQQQHPLATINMQTRAHLRNSTRTPVASQNYLILLLAIALPLQLANAATQVVLPPSTRPTPKSASLIQTSVDLLTFEEPPLQPKSNERSQQQQQQQQPTPKPVQYQPIYRPLNATGSNLFTGASLSNVRTQWRHMDHTVGDSISSYAKYLRQVIVDEPHLVSNISKRCRLALVELVDSLDERHLWASQMLDASARLPAGLLEGTLTELGSFDQCLSIVGRTLQQQQQQQLVEPIAPLKDRTVYGQYCSIVVKPAMIQRPRLHTVCRKLPALSANTSSGVMKMLSLNSHQFYYVGLRLGVCVPSKCAQADLQQLLATYLLKYDLVGQVKSCQNRVPTATTNTAAALTWLDSIWGISIGIGTSTLDTTQKCIILTFAVLLSLTLIGTIVDLSSSSASTAPLANGRLVASQSVCKQCKGAIVLDIVGMSGLRHQSELESSNDNSKQQQQQQQQHNGKAHLCQLRDQWLHPLRVSAQHLSSVFCAKCLASQQRVGCNSGSDDANALIKSTAAAAANGRRYWHYQVCPNSVASTTPVATGVRTELSGGGGDNVAQYNESAESDMCLNARRVSSLNGHCLLDSTSDVSGTSPNNGQRPLIGPQINPLAQLTGGSTCNYSSDDSSFKNWFANDSDRYDSEPALALPLPVAPPLSGKLIKQHQQRQQQQSRHRMQTWAEPEVGATAYVSSRSAVNELDGDDPHARLRAFLLCFSLRVNLRVICKLGESSSQKKNNPKQSTINALNGDIKCIHGLRTLAMVWIIFGHTIGLVSPEMMNNLFPLARLSCQSRLLQALLNATLAVDTFFMISGLVTAISFARKCSSVHKLVAGEPSYKQRQRQVNDQKSCDTNRKLAQHNKSTLVTTTTEATDSTSLSSTSSVSASPSSSSSDLSASQSASSSLPFDIGRSTKPPPPVAGRLRTLSRVSPLHWMQIASNSNFKSNLKHAPASFVEQQKSSSTPSSSGAPQSADGFRPVLWICMRYLRLTPAYAAIIGATILLPALGSGPFWTESIEPLASQCRNNWWLNLAYLNNFFETDKLCLIHSWYLSNDCQMFIMATLLLAVMYRSKRVALLLALVICLASSAMTFAVTVANELPPTIVTTSPAVAERWLFIYSLYYKPWPHLTSYIIGLLTGYLIIRSSVSKTSLTTKGSKIESTRGWKRKSCWLMVTALALALLNSIYPWNMGFQVDPLITGLHSATFRSLWALCNAWLVWAIVSSEAAATSQSGSAGGGGSRKSSLGSVLSWTGFQMSSRLTYCAYLVHPLIIYYHFGTLRERMDSSVYSQTHRFLATLFMSYLAALLLSLLVESPVIQLQRFLLEPRTKAKKSTKKDHNTKSQAAQHQDLDLHQLQQHQQQPPPPPQHRRHRRQWPIKLEARKPYVADALEAASGGQQDEVLRKVPSSSSSSGDSSMIGASASDQKPLTSGHFCPHLVAAIVPVQPAIAPTSTQRAPVGSDAAQVNSETTTATDGAARESGACSGHSAVDEQFQRKLAQAIGRGFKIRSKIAAANYTSNACGHVRKLAATTSGDEPAQAQARAAGPNECDLHLFHRCDHIVSTAGVGPNVVSQRPTRPNRAELSTFLAHCNSKPAIVAVDGCANDKSRAAAE